MTTELTVTPACRERTPCRLQLVLGLLIAAFISAASFPGYMSYDSVQELRQARTAVEGNQYPPFGSYVWRVVDWIWPGPTLMQFLQNAMVLVAAAYLLSRTRLPLLVQGVFLIAFAAAPPIFGTMIVVWKDVAVGACFLSATALLLASRGFVSVTTRRIVVIVSVVLIWAGMAYRFNAGPAALPLLILACAVWPRRDSPVGEVRKRPIRLVALTGCLLLAVLFVATWVLNSYRMPSFERLQRNTNPDSIMAFDIIGTSVFLGESLVDSTHGGKVPIDYLRRIYDPRHLNLVGINDKEHLVQPPERHVAEQWVSIIFNHPLAYLRHRAAVFKEYIGFHNHEVFYVTNPAIDVNTLGVSESPSAFKEFFKRYLWEGRLWLVTHTYIYYLLAMISFAAMWISRGRRLALEASVLFSSGMLYLIPMFFISPAADLRYNFYSVAASMLTTAVAVASMLYSLPPRYQKIAPGVAPENQV